jgi:hypothetical protein
MEVDMASSDASTEATSQTLGSLGVDPNLQVVSLPAGDVELLREVTTRLPGREGTD